jgi:NhaA family Na+:H+ antiporter
MGDQEEILSEIEDVAQGSEAPLERMERALHPWVSYGVMPIFALANAGVVLNSDVISDAASSDVTYGIVLGLVVGKPLGILAFAWISCRLGICSLPNGASWSHITGVAILAGIGFTVSLFITGLAFPEDGLVDNAKIGIFFASIVAGVAGYVFLLALARRNERFLREEAALGGAT